MDQASDQWPAPGCWPSSSTRRTGSGARSSRYAAWAHCPEAGPPPPGSVRFRARRRATAPPPASTSPIPAPCSGVNKTAQDHLGDDRLDRCSKRSLRCGFTGDCAWVRFNRQLACCDLLHPRPCRPGIEALRDSDRISQAAKGRLRDVNLRGRERDRVEARPGIGQPGRISDAVPGTEKTARLGMQGVRGHKPIEVGGSYFESRPAHPVSRTQRPLGLHKTVKSASSSASPTVAWSRTTTRPSLMSIRPAAESRTSSDSINT
jgi:hypothetical protein